MAAGKGTRMKSDLPKVLCPVLGRPLIEYVLDALSGVGVERVVVVVGYRSDLVRETLAGRPGIEFAEQTEQLLGGTVSFSASAGKGVVSGSGSRQFMRAAASGIKWGRR